MDQVIKTLNDFVDTCATCRQRIKGLCGYADKSVSQNIVGEEEYYIMSPDEIELYQTRIWHQPCEQQINEQSLLSKVSEGVDSGDIYLTEDWILKVITKLYEVRSKVARNGAAFKNTFMDQVDNAIQMILSRLDLIFLQNSKDIQEILEMTGLNYKRYESLSNICPLPIIKRYEAKARPFDDVPNIPAPTSLPMPTLEEEPETSQLEKHVFTVPEGLSAVDEYMLRYAGAQGLYPITSLLIRAGYEDMVWGEMWDTLGITREEWAEMYSEDWKRYEFKRWSELRTEISGEIKKRVSDELELKKYVCSLINPFERYDYYSLIDSDSKIFVEVKTFLHFYLTEGYRTSDVIIDLWRKVVDQVKAKGTENELTLDEYEKALYRGIDDAQSENFIFVECPEAEAYHDREELKYWFPGLIEGCLLENGASLEYLDYQEMCGVYLTPRLDAFSVAHAMDWTEELVYSYNPKRVSKTILGTKDEEEEKLELDELGPKKLGQKTATDHFLAIYGSDRVAHYIEAIIALLGFDHNMSFRKVDHMMSWYGERIKEYHDGFTLPEFDRWEELAAEVDTKIKTLKRDNCELDNYIYSMIRPLEGLCQYIYPQKDDCMHATGATALKLFAHAQTYDIDEFNAKWKETADKVKSSPEYHGISTEGYLELMKSSFNECADGIRLPILGGEASVVSMVIDNLSNFAAVIEGAMLKNGLENDFWYYQTSAQVTITEEIELFSVAFNMGMTQGQAQTYITKYKHRLSLGPVEDDHEEDEVNDFSITVSFGDISILPKEFITKQAAAIWEKAFDKKLIDSDFKPKGTRLEQALFAGNLSIALFGKIDWVTIRKWHDYQYYAQKYGEVSHLSRNELSAIGKKIYDLFA